MGLSVKSKIYKGQCFRSLMDQQKELEDTFLEEWEATLLLEKEQKYKATTILLSKALFALADYIIFQKYHQLPKNHTERFRILEAKEQKTYKLIDSVWSKYTDTYSKPSAEESIRLLKQTIQEVAQYHENIRQAIKTTLKKTSRNH